MPVNRRELLQAATLFAAVAGLPGCKRPVATCPSSEEYSDPRSALLIDVHAHVFNATDLQVRQFIRLVATHDTGGLGKVAQLLAGALQKFAWATAPTVADERIQLDRIRPMIEQCSAEEVRSGITNLRDVKYTEGREEIQRAAQQRMEELSIDPERLANDPTESMSAEEMEFLRLTSLPENYGDLFNPPDLGPMESAPEAITFRSAVKFIIEMLQYRYVSVYNNLDTYNQENGLKVDLMLPALVDYDWWLSKGTRTKSGLPDQMELMKDIAILTGGRVHMQAPFDPFRQVVADLGEDSTFSPIDKVRNAVENCGAIGVKLYPPMGFAPFGNAAIGSNDPDFWKEHWLPELTRRQDFGVRLDTAMKKLLDYCGEHDVPVMGHSNQSNGASAKFEALTGPEHWRRVYEDFDDVSLSFGHFGGVGSSSAEGQSPVEGFLELLARDEAGGTQRLAADASYFSNLIDHPERLRAALETILDYGDDKPVRNRLMYGVDWKMLVAEKDSDKYLKKFDAVITGIEGELGAESLRTNILGGNAARFFGLTKGGGNRRRLERFYEEEGLKETPTWMAKVDALPRWYHGDTKL